MRPELLEGEGPKGGYARKKAIMWCNFTTRSQQQRRQADETKVTCVLMTFIRTDPAAPAKTPRAQHQATRGAYSNLLTLFLCSCMERSTGSSAQPSPLGVLQAASLSLFGIFLVSVILRALPPRILDPLWQVSLTTALLDMGGYALLGVVVLTIAHLLEPDDGPLLRLLRRVTRLCGVAALGYLLLLPLLLSALVRDYQQVERLSQRQQRSISQQELRLSKAIASSQSRDELLGTVQRFNAPALGSFLLSPAPLETQRAQAQELLSSTVANARRQAGAVSPASLQSILLNNLRLLLLALVFAFGFSSAYTGCLSFPLLHPLRLWLMQRQWARSSRGPSKSSSYPEQVYFESLTDDDSSTPPT